MDLCACSVNKQAAFPRRYTKMNTCKVNAQKKKMPVIRARVDHFCWRESHGHRLTRRARDAFLSSVSALFERVSETSLSLRS
jgi:hypothetical protein